MQGPTRREVIRAGAKIGPLLAPDCGIGRNVALSDAEPARFAAFGGDPSGLSAGYCSFTEPTIRHDYLFFCDPSGSQGNLRLKIPLNVVALRAA